MVGALVDHLARGVDIVYFGDRENGRRSLRPSLPDSTGAKNCDSDQSESR